MTLYTRDEQIPIIQSSGKTSYGNRAQTNSNHSQISEFANNNENKYENNEIYVEKCISQENCIECWNSNNNHNNNNDNIG